MKQHNLEVAGNFIFENVIMFLSYITSNNVCTPSITSLGGSRSCLNQLQANATCVNSV